MGSPQDGQATRSDGGNKINDANYDVRHCTAEEKNQQLKKEKLKAKITFYRNQRICIKNRNLTTIKRPKKVYQALNLPKLLNLNPRSAMNKIEHITEFIEEENIDIAFISESHDRENKRLEDHIKINTHTVISNLYQRPTKEKKYNVENLTTHMY